MTFFDPFRQTLELGLRDFHAETLEHVDLWLASDECPLGEHARQDYRRSIRKLARLERKALGDLLADNTWFQNSYPNSKYTRDWGRTVDAAIRWKRKVSAAINGATGAIAARKERQARQDGWKELIDLLTAATSHPGRLPFPLHEKKVIGIRSTADLARQLDTQPVDIDLEVARQLYQAASNTGTRDAVVATLSLFDRLLGVPDSCVQRLLPAQPIGFVAPAHVRTVQLPKHVRDELDAWVEIASRGTWSITDEKFTGGVSADPFLKAAKKIISTAGRIRCLDLEALSTVASAFDRSVLVVVMRTLRTWQETGSHGAIAPRTARLYLETLIPFLERNGESADAVRAILATDQWLKTAPSGGQKMTARAKAFCRRVVTDKKSQIEFLSLHIKLRQKAIHYLTAAARSKGKKRMRLLKKARQWGTCAAFAALETDAIPLRISNALAVTHRGESPWLSLGVKASSNGHLCIPAGKTKNGKGIFALILAESKLRGLETLRWFEKVIRPLYPDHAANDHFFPSVTKPGEPLLYETFRIWWSSYIAECGFPGMTPHLFRHGQASILVAKNPGNWSLISARLGDTEAVCQSTYTWIDHEQLVLAGQRLLAEGLPNAA